jgi:hypothetical protein
MIACATVNAPRPRPCRRPTLGLAAARAGLLAGALVLPLVGPGAAAAEGPRAALISGRGELRVETLGGESLRATLPEGVTVHALAPLAGRAWLAAGTRSGTGDGSALVLYRGEGGEAERLAGPEPGGAILASPTPLASGGGLVGLAWLAGDDPGRLTVRFAPWVGGAPIPGAGGEWGEPELVAGPATGSQLALAGAALADGSTVLVWSAFYGDDDEVLWSVRAAGRWSEPARLAEDNAVPDVTPAVAPLGAGALAAWSRYDGSEYRLVASRWTGERWTAPEPLAAPGSLYPSFHPGDGGPLLLYRDARRQGWAVLRLEETGRVAARAFLGASPPDSTPALLGADARGVRVVLRAGGRAVERPWDPLP